MTNRPDHLPEIPRSLDQPQRIGGIFRITPFTNEYFVCLIIYIAFPLVLEVANPWFEWSHGNVKFVSGNSLIILYFAISNGPLRLLSLLAGIVFLATASGEDGGLSFWIPIAISVGFHCLFAVDRYRVTNIGGEPCLKWATIIDLGN